MRYLSVCSGIEAATVAWHTLGWTPVAFSEIEPFPAAVLAHHYPDVPNYGDMTKHKEWPLEPGSIDLLVGGTPCQSFSVAGLRKGISDPRGGLMLTYLEIAQRLRPRWIVWENVPGVLSSGGGRDFGSFLGALGELRYGWAYRVIDAQYCRVDGRWPKAVPQRRRRVFVVGCDLERDPGGRERTAEVLALGTGLRWHLAESGKTRKAAPSDAEAGVGAGCWWDGGGCAGTLTKQNAGGAQRMPDKDNFGAVLQPVGYRWQNDRDGLVEDGTAPACRASAGSSGFHEMNHPVVLARDNAAHAAVAFTPGNLARGAGPSPNAEVAPTLNQSARGTGAPGYSDQEIFSQGAGNLVPQPVAFAIYGGNKRVDRPEGGFYVREEDTARTLDAAQGLNPTCSQGGTCITQPVPFTKSKRAQSVTDDETWVDGKVNPTLSLFDQGDTRATTVAVAFHPTQDPISSTDGSTHCMGTGGSQGHASIAVACPTLTAHNDPSRSPQSSEVTQQVAAVHAASMTVRRLTPRECERLQAFPDDYTLIPWRKKPATECPDGPRYKALGNSMAVNCMAWIGERIAAVEANNGAASAPPSPPTPGTGGAASTNGGE